MSEGKKELQEKTGPEETREQSPENKIGNLPIAQWIEGGLNGVPEVRTADDLQKILNIKGWIERTQTTEDNWSKGKEDWEWSTEERQAVYKYLQDNWVRNSGELRRKAIQPWLDKFRDITERSAFYVPLSEKWLETYKHLVALFPGHARPDYVVDKLERASKTTEDLSWINAGRLRETLGLPIDIETRKANLRK